MRSGKPSASDLSAGWCPAQGRNTVSTLGEAESAPGGGEQLLPSPLIEGTQETV
jgi:hypothetical protein